jgi:flagellar protein FliO/FliZ
MKLLLAAPCSLIAPSLYAAARQSEAAPGVPGSPVGTGALMETAIGLLLILLLILGLAWVVRRFGKLPLAGKGMVSILGGVSLGPRERAVVLQVGETRLLVGVAPGRVQTLHVLSREAATDQDFSGQLHAQMEKQEQ